MSEKRRAWRAAWETIERARQEITTYMDTYHHRHHFGIGTAPPPRPGRTYKPERPEPTTETGSTSVPPGQ